MAPVSLTSPDGSLGPSCGRAWSPGPASGRSGGPSPWLWPSRPRPPVAHPHSGSPNVFEHFDFDFNLALSISPILKLFRFSTNSHFCIFFSCTFPCPLHHNLPPFYSQDPFALCVPPHTDRVPCQGLRVSVSLHVFIPRIRQGSIIFLRFPPTLYPPPRRSVTNSGGGRRDIIG